MHMTLNLTCALFTDENRATLDGLDGWVNGEIYFGVSVDNVYDATHRVEDSYRLVSLRTDSLIKLGSLKGFK